MKRLSDRVAIITGGGQGIGKALALGLAREGATVVIADIDAGNAAAVKTKIEAEGGTALAVETNVSSEDSVEAMADTSLREFGNLHYSRQQCRNFPVKPN